MTLNHYGLAPCHEQPGKQRWHLVCAVRHQARFLRSRGPARWRYGAPFRVYVAGPMAGLPDHNFPAFHAEAERLRALGYKVVSPAEGVSAADLVEATAAGSAWRETQKYRDYLKRDVRLVLDCHAVQLLPGWNESYGARLEVTVARGVGIEVWEA